MTLEGFLWGLFFMGVGQIQVLVLRDRLDRRDRFERGLRRWIKTNRSRRK